MKRVADLNLPIGWTDRAWSDFRDAGVKEQLYAGLGWLLTAFALSFGAPFWFDVLNKIMIIRSTVKPAQKSPTDASPEKAKGAT